MTAEKLEKKEVTEVKAFARGLHVSPRKARLVVDVLKNLSVAEALTQLDFLTKRAAGPIKKLVNSAVANASHNFQIEADQLFIKSFTVDGGRVFFRYEPRAQGRAFPVRKRTSHLNLVLGVRKTAVKAKKKPVTAPAKKEISEEKPAGALVAAGESEEGPEEKKSRFSFWPKKSKEAKPSQVAPKADSKGRHYTSFDRRGSM